MTQYNLYVKKGNRFSKVSRIKLYGLGEVDFTNFIVPKTMTKIQYDLRLETTKRAIGETAFYDKQHYQLRTKAGVVVFDSDFYPYPNGKVTNICGVPVHVSPNGAVGKIYYSDNPMKIVEHLGLVHRGSITPFMRSEYRTIKAFEQMPFAQATKVKDVYYAVDKPLLIFCATKAEPNSGAFLANDYVYMLAPYIEDVP